MFRLTELSPFKKLFRCLTLRTPKRHCLFSGSAAFVVALLSAASAAFATTSIEAVDPSHFRVCADPDNLPYSSEKGAGFENKIAELLAKQMNRPLLYTWAPLGPAFLVTTLNTKVCDVVIGIPAGAASVLNTNPYYRMNYVMVYRKDSGIKATSITDPAMKKLKIGVVAGTVTNFLMEENNLLNSMTGYSLRNDVQIQPVPDQMLEDLKNKVIDVALMAGPTVSYWAKKEKVDVVMIPLENAKRPGGRMDYLMTMGVRHGENDWKRELNDAIRKTQPQINEILKSYGVPVLNMVGPPVAAGSAPQKPSAGESNAAAPEKDGAKPAAGEASPK
ncbi:MAG: quinoprotein dehydrogenase-associated putative ABC transporter substrate-binding protein [Alphaproteobacteria bacterium]